MAIEGLWVFIFALAVVGSIALLFFFFWLTWRTFQQTGGTSPYTSFPLRPADELPYYTIERIYHYLNGYHQFDNRMFDVKKAAFCRETGRIFPDAISWLWGIHVDWSFLRKRSTGHYVSWGSLSHDQQREILERHEGLDGFQTEFSSPHPLPKEITAEYIYTKPGPLYVDLETKTVVGWKEVPGTELEVLIVQKPVK